MLRGRRRTLWAVVDTIAEVSGHDLADLLLHADDETLKRTDRAQIATFALEMVVLAHYRACAASDAAVVGYAGHSLGEYSALVATEILELRDAARLVEARGAAMLAAAEARPGTMIAVIGASADAIADALAPLQATGTQAWIANLNAPDQTVVVGDATGIEQATAACSALGKVVALAVGGAFHSPLMASAESALHTALEQSHVRERYRARRRQRRRATTSRRAGMDRPPRASADRAGPLDRVGPYPAGCFRVRRFCRDRTGHDAVEPHQAHRARHADGTGHAGLMVRELGPHREYVL